jgi:DNA-binding NtrC family response regulator
MTAVPRGEGLLSLAEVRAKAVEEAERSYLHELLSVNQGRIEASAKAAGITTRQLYNLMVKHKLKKEDYRP